MQPIIKWVVGRPQNGVFALAGTLLLPLSPVLSGVVMALLVLQHGFRLPVLQAVAAAAVLAGVALLAGASATQILANAVEIWLPVFLLVMLLRHWRSLTLTLQVSVLLAAIATIAFFVVLGDPTEYWNNVLNNLAKLFRENNLLEQADLLESRQTIIAPQMTMLFVFLSWSLYVLDVLLGYALIQSVDGNDGAFGRFRDLNFGRVLALILALASILALVTGAVALQNVAFVIFATFWLQGLALLHWLRANGRLPAFVLVATYALLPVLNVILVIAFAIVGYTDAWFNYRKRAVTTDS